MHASDQFRIEATVPGAECTLPGDAGGTGVRATHVATGLSVCCALYRSAMRNREAACHLLIRFMERDRSLSMRVMAAVRWVSDSAELNELDVALLGPVRVGDCTLLSIDEIAEEIIHQEMATRHCIDDDGGSLSSAA